jgi:AraC-like DNA-binding protein
VLALRERVAANPRQVGLAVVARALGMSTRTLQHHLALAGTSFRQEIHLSRVLAAQRLLAETDDKLSAIALEIGCASLQHFSTLFRKHTGESPSAWRARHRPPARANDQGRRG